MYVLYQYRKWMHPRQKIKKIKAVYGDAAELPSILEQQAHQ